MYIYENNFEKKCLNYIINFTNILITLGIVHYLLQRAEFFWGRGNRLFIKHILLHG